MFATVFFDAICVLVTCNCVFGLIIIALANIWLSNVKQGTSWWGQWPSAPSPRVFFILLCFSNSSIARISTV
jgi:hypothetical protein